jgi:hypothetical protein
LLRLIVVAIGKYGGDIAERIVFTPLEIEIVQLSEGPLQVALARRAFLIVRISASGAG